VGDVQNSCEESSWRQQLVTLLPILAVYMALAFYNIDSQSLWQDEFHSLKRVTSAIPLWRDGHGFLYFALLTLWVHLGDSAATLRSLSVVFGAAAVCLVYKFASVLLNRRMAVIGTALFATSPYFIWYSQETRYVTLTIATTLLMMWAFHAVIAGRASVVGWLAYGSAALLAFFSFLSTLLLPIVHGLYLWLLPATRPLLRKWLACQFIVFVLFAGWFVNGTHFWQAYREAKASGQTLTDNPKVLPFTGDFNNVRPAVIPYTLFAFSTGFSLGPPPRELYADRSFAPLAPFAPMIFVLAGLYGTLLASALLATYRWPQPAILLLLWLGIPVLGAFSIAKLLDIFYDVRYVAMAFPAYILLLTLGIGRFRKRSAQLLLVSAVLSVHGASLANYYFDTRYAREDTRSAAKYLESSTEPQDFVLVLGTVSSLRHYYKGNLPVVSFNQFGGGDRPLSELFTALSTSYDRLWLVQIRPWQVDRAGKVKAALDRAYPLVEQQSFPGVGVFAYALSQ
jgi:4-amino-4-deoxy-L-arabinose transferase-like glycosyltransferase